MRGLREQRQPLRLRLSGRVLRVLRLLHRIPQLLRELRHVLISLSSDGGDEFGDVSVITAEVAT